MGDQFNIGDIVKIKEGGVHFYAGQRGRVTHVGLPGGSRLEIKMRDNNITYASDAEVTVLPKPEVGDLVRVLSSGRWQAQEGHISEIIGERIFIDELEHDWNRPEFQPLFIEIIEKIKPLPVRIEGREIKPEDIKRGDKISVVTKNDDSEIKTTEIREAVVDKALKKGFHNSLNFEFQSRTGTKIHSTIEKPDAEIYLVKSIDNNPDFQSLSEFKEGDVISFPDEEGGPEINLAVRQTLDDYWSLLLGSKKSKVVQTVGLVNILDKKGVTFSVVRKGEDKPEFEFPKGQHVKVQKGAFKGVFDGGDYRVIIPGKDASTIKSRGISAATYEIQNKYLIKD